MTGLLVKVLGVTKQYGALRPLRIERLEIEAGEQLAILGLDQPAAEVFINLITGASLPDAGTIRVFDRLTADITDGTEWLSTLDRFGIVSDRAALLEPLSVVQNLAVPFSLDIEPPPAGIRAQALQLAEEVRLPLHVLEQRVADLDPVSRVRVRLARALALNPTLLLLEHPSATIPRGHASELARDVRAAAERRGAATVALTVDSEFAAAVAARALTLEPSTGRLKPIRPGRIGFWS